MRDHYAREICKVMKKITLVAAIVGSSACSTIAPPAIASAEPRAETAQAEPVEIAAGKLISVLTGATPPQDYFDPSFIAAVPTAQIKQISDSLIAQYGAPQSVEITEKLNPNSGKIAVHFEKGIVRMNLAARAAPPHKVSGLLITASEAKDDSAAKIDADFKALPGKAGYIVAKLSTAGSPEILAGHNIGEQFAIGSTFKLYILAELASQIEAGKRNWDDVAPLAHRSFSSQATRRWPENAPMTLQSLASMMIATSDNSATDTLLHLLGREQIEAKLASIGHSAPDKTLPFLSTVEAFAIKSSDALHAEFTAASEAGQRTMLAAKKDQLGFDDVDNNAFADGPRFIDAIEWFASPADIVGLMEFLKKARNDKILEIMAINTGIGEDDSKKWDYLGFKGGSEPGVISLSYLAHSKSGDWYAISGSWNNTKTEVDTTRMVGLMTRLLSSYSGK